MFGLFGGKKKKEEAKPAAAPVKADAPKAEVKAAAPVVSAVEKVAAKPAASAAPVTVVAMAPGAEQVKLRLKLAAAKRAGQTAAAYSAAKGLADIQAKAGRRLGARMWKQEADRILERDPKAA